MFYDCYRAGNQLWNCTHFRHPTDERLRQLNIFPGGVLRDQSDGDVRRIFLGSKFSIPGFFWVGEFGRYFFGWLYLNRGFFWVLIQTKVPWRGLGNLGVIWQGIFFGRFFGPGIFLGNVGRLRDFFGSWVLPPFDHPRHFDPGVPPLGIFSGSPLRLWSVLLELHTYVHAINFVHFSRALRVRFFFKKLAHSRKTYIPKY